jgi:hypothetical protein
MASIAHETISQMVKGHGLGRTIVPWAIPALPKKVKQMSVTKRPAPACVGVGPEVLATISASITTFFGREVRILSVKKMQPLNRLTDQWAGQGRVAVQGSHNLIQRGR